MLKRRLIAFFFLLFYTTALPGVSEMYRIPIFIEHYSDHKKSDPHVTGLIEYIIQHYYIENGTDDDASEDQQLPFKSKDAFLNLISYIIVPALNTEPEKNFYITVLYQPGNESLLPTPYIQQVWQPPRKD
jgi:hypothetical protein